MNVNSKIAEYILRAQNASDGGKGIRYFESSQRASRDNFAGYAQKDKMIASAINLIRRNDCDFRYCVIKNGFIAYFIVYFEVCIEGTKYQVSFHSFDENLERFSHGLRTKWDHGNSRDSAVKIYKHYVPNGTYA